MDPDQIDAHTWNGAGGHGDFDGDGLVTAEDFAYFEQCMSGPGQAPTPGEPVTPGDCWWAFDFDGDGDVDVHDYAVFSALVGGD